MIANEETELEEIDNCPYCENEATYFPETNEQASAIYCNECPLGVEYSGMSYECLVAVWNRLPRRW